MLINILLLPLLSFLILFFFGRFLWIKGAIQVALSCLSFSFFLSIIGLYFYVLKEQESILIWFGRWFSVENMIINWGFLFDGISLIMCVIVTGISFLVHYYSLDYMKEDPNLIKFLSYLSLFTFFMLMLVLSDNFIQLFFGWEGVGLSSFLLINFWHTRILANKAAIKAMIVNRFGDFGLLVGIIYIFSFTKTINFGVLFSLIPYLTQEYVKFFFFDIKLITLIGFFLFIGVIGKSAQIGLHTWLPDAMEGPTPVSALIHAATMVTAGVFVLIRCAPIFEASDNLSFFITFIGALTIFFSSVVGWFQNDIKKVIAYSTCSQLGYMVFACGLSNYIGGFLHLVNHAFFKALLFLGAGSVIHALIDEQDMRKMGGLVNLLPLTYLMILTGILALIGFPYLTGFYSKDFLLEYGFVINSFWFSLFLFTIAVFSVFSTAFYSFRMLYLVFLTKPNFNKINLNFIHEMPMKMRFSLFILWVGSVFIGFFIQEWFLGYGIWYGVIDSNSKITNFIELEFIPFYIIHLPFILSFFGMILGYFSSRFFNKFFLNKILKKDFNNLNLKVFRFLVGKWYFDNIYNKIISSVILYSSYNWFFKSIDRGFLEIFGPLGLVRGTSFLSKMISKIQTGYIYHYIFVMLLGLILFLVVDFSIVFSDMIFFWILVYILIIKEN